ncbi:hypothetical protein JCM8547_002475 [Rhodosporidiobolus lusitaniae]
MPPPKRSLSRSPSPSLPAYLFLAPSSSSSRPSASTADPALRLPAHLAHGIQAHEATLLPGGPGEDWEELAGELEDEVEVEVAPLASSGAGAETVEGRSGKGSRKVRWKGAREGTGEEVEVSTDRYDILHLLLSLPAHLPPPSSRSQPSPPSPSPARSPSPGFSDLPSDHEELFFFSPSERKALARKKKKRRLLEGREERVRKARERDEREERERGMGVEEEDKEEEGDEPSEPQLSLMLRLHSTLSSSPNPTLLELRILANHGSDPKFASILKKEGRWRGVWKRIRSGEWEREKKREEEEERRKREEKGGAGGLAGLAEYGSDSEEDEEEEEEPAKEEKQALSPSLGAGEDQPTAPSPPDDEKQWRKQLEKQEKAKEWARKRREAREAKEAEEKP